MARKLTPTKPIDVSAYERAHGLPRYLPDALDKFRASKPLRETLGGEFADRHPEVAAALQLGKGSYESDTVPRG